MGAAFTEADERWMRRALALAARGRGRVEPNPMVGCVIVRRGRVIGEGYHRRFGGAHAEIDALRRCVASPRGADVYVTLEPCCHVGKTGPCTDALLEAGVGRVVAAMQDPFTRVAGRGFRILRRAGIAVEVGLCREAAEELNAPYLKLRRRGRPWVILKWAQSLDGRIATRTGDSKWISGPESRRFVHRLRGRVDAVVVGMGTLRRDDPLLTCRTGRPRRIATRIVLDSRLEIAAGCRLLRSTRDAPVIVAVTAEALRRRPARAARIASAGAEVLGLPSRRGRIDLRALLAELGRREMTNVLVEGGGEVLGSLHDEGLGDEAYVFMAPRIIGGRGAVGAIGGEGIRRMADAVRLPRVTCRRLGGDWLFHVRYR